MRVRPTPPQPYIKAKVIFTEEIWKDLIYQGVNYGERFKISNTGKIKNKKTDNILKLNVGKTGYYQVNVSLGNRKSKKLFKLHKALAETFIPNPDSLPFVNHIDGNKLNNSLDNLEWCTHRYNVIHAFEHNLIDVSKFRGYNNAYAKFSEEDVRYIRNNYIPRDKEFGARALARKFNVGYSTVWHIIHNRSYKNVS